MVIDFYVVDYVVDFHAGGASRIADNLYYDPDEQCDKKIVPGYSSSISMHAHVGFMIQNLEKYGKRGITFTLNHFESLSLLITLNHLGIHAAQYIESPILDPLGIQSDTAQYIQSPWNHVGKYAAH